MSRIHNEPQVFDSDILEKITRSCETLLNTIEEKRIIIMKTFNNLLDVGLCSNMISDYNDSISNISYEIELLKEQLTYYNNLIKDLEGNSSKSFDNYDVKVKRKDSSTKPLIRVDVNTNVNDLRDSLISVLPQGEGQILVEGIESTLTPSNNQFLQNVYESNVLSDFEVSTIDDMQTLKKLKTSVANSISEFDVANNLNLVKLQEIKSHAENALSEFKVASEADEKKINDTLEKLRNKIYSQKLETLEKTNNKIDSIYNEAYNIIEKKNN